MMASARGPHAPPSSGAVPFNTPDLLSDRTPLDPASAGPRSTSAAVTASEHLRHVDPLMASLIDRVGLLEIVAEPDLWRSIVGSIVGQQLSVAAARTIRGRVAELGAAGFPVADEILGFPDEVLRGAGLSRAKVMYLRDLAERWKTGELDPAGIAQLPDEEVVARLVRVKGIGRWTAEMVLLFSMGRPDVFALDDLGLRVGLQHLYGLPERPDRETMVRISDAWRPYRSYASLYLWRARDG